MRSNAPIKLSNRASRWLLVDLDRADFPSPTLPEQYAPIVALFSLLAATATCCTPLRPFPSLLINACVLPPLWLAFGSIFVIWAYRSGRNQVIRAELRICPHCRYALVNLDPDGVCPECGQPYTADTLRRTWTTYYELDP